MTIAPDPAEIDHKVRSTAAELLAAGGGAMVPHANIAAMTGYSDETVEDSLRRQQESGLVRFYAEGTGPLRVYEVG